MKIALYKGRRRLFNKVASWWLNGPYSHAELVMTEDEGDGCFCISSSFLDGGVRGKLIKLDPENWDLVEVTGDEAQAWAWFYAHDGAGYDVLGAASFVIPPIGHSRTRFSCGESVAAMLGYSGAERFEPNILGHVTRHA